SNTGPASPARCAWWAWRTASCFCSTCGARCRRRSSTSGRGSAPRWCWWRACCRPARLWWTRGCCAPPQTRRRARGSTLDRERSGVLVVAVELDGASVGGGHAQGLGGGGDHQAAVVFTGDGREHRDVFVRSRADEVVVGGAVATGFE